MIKNLLIKLAYKILDKSHSEYVPEITLRSKIRVKGKIFEVTHYSVEVNGTTMKHTVNLSAEKNWRD